jgi:hypothetical protein
MFHPTLPAKFFVEFGACLVMALCSSSLFFFMLLKPRRWSRLVDRENDFSVRIGIAPAGLSNWCRRLEKGPVLKIMAGVVALLSLRLLLLVWHRYHLG